MAAGAIHTHIVPAEFPAYAGKHGGAHWPHMAPAHDCHHKNVIVDGKNLRTATDECWDITGSSAFADDDSRDKARVMNTVTKSPLRVGVAGLGAVGLEVARRLIDGDVPGLTLAAVAVRNIEKARDALPQIGDLVALRTPAALADDSDIVVECLPPALFRELAVSVVDKGRLLMPLSVAQLLENGDLIERAKETGARIVVPTGALLGLDAVRAAAEGTIYSVKMVTRKPPAGLEGAPYLRARDISLAGLKAPTMVFDGSAREGARGFPTNVNVAAALSLAGIGPDRTELQIWADPTVTRNTHTITVDADTMRFTMTIENVPSQNPRTGKSVAPSTIAALRGLVSTLKVGS